MEVTCRLRVHKQQMFRRVSRKRKLGRSFAKRTIWSQWCVFLPFHPHQATRVSWGLIEIAALCFALFEAAGVKHIDTAQHRSCWGREAIKNVCKCSRPKCPWNINGCFCSLLFTQNTAQMEKTYGNYSFQKQPGECAMYLISRNRECLMAYMCTTMNMTAFIQSRSLDLILLSAESRLIAKCSFGRQWLSLAELEIWVKIETSWEICNCWFFWNWKQQTKKLKVKCILIKSNFLTLTLSFSSGLDSHLNDLKSSRTPKNQF